MRFCKKAFMLCVLLFSNGFIVAQNPSEYTPQDVRALFRRDAVNMKFSDPLGKTLNFKLNETPLFNWQNPARLQHQGQLFVWSDEGRPKVLASLYTFVSKNQLRYRHEVLSLSDSPFVSEIAPWKLWRPKTTALRWLNFTRAPSPTDNANQRMSQMKSLARTLTAQITEKSGKLTQLELLPQPLHRYASPQNDILDGAIFAMAFGTDPEVYLFIEDFLENNQRKWRYSPVRSHYLKLAVNENDTEVWRVDENLRLEATNADETELSREPFFVYNLPYPIPKPEELRLETPTPAKQ